MDDKHENGEMRIKFGAGSDSPTKALDDSDLAVVTAEHQQDDDTTDPGLEVITGPIPVRTGGTHN